MLKTMIIQLLLFFSSYIIPKKNKLIILGSGEKKEFRGNPKFFYLYLNYYKPEVSAYWSTNSKEVFNRLSSEGLPVLYRKSISGFFKIIRAKYLVIEKSSPDVYYTKPIWDDSILFRHGMESYLKKRGWKLWKITKVYLLLLY